MQPGQKLSNSAVSLDEKESFPWFEESWDLCWQQMRQPLPPCVRVEASSVFLARQVVMVTAEAEDVLSLLLPWDPKPIAWCPRAYRLAPEKAVDDQGHYKPELAKAAER